MVLIIVFSFFPAHTIAMVNNYVYSNVHCICSPQVYGNNNLLRENDHIISINDQLTSSMNNGEIINALKQEKLLLVVKRYAFYAWTDLVI